MIPNQRNIELVAVGNTQTILKLVLDSDGVTAWSSGKAPVRIVRGAPGEANYWSSDVIKWAPGMTLTPIGANAPGVEDKWTLPSINSIVDGDNPARELNLRVWPVGLSSIDWQRMINTGHFLELAATRSPILVATEFASILSLDYKNQREHQSGGLIAYATSSETGSKAVTGAATFTENSKTFVIDTNVGAVVAGDYLEGASGAIYRIASINGLVGELDTVAVKTEAAAALAYAKADLETTLGDKNAGLVVEATPNKFVTGQYNYEKTRLQVTTGGMGAVEYTEMAFEGVGTAEQVAEREWFAKGNEGKPMRTNNMAPYNGPHLEATGILYDVFSLGFTHDMLEPLGQPNNSPKGIFVAELKGATALHALLTTYIAQ